MKIIILKSNLKAGLDAVGRTVGANPNLPILGSVLIKAQNNQIKISATNLELAITKQTFGKIIEEGSVVVPYNTLSNMINNVSTERVNLEVKKNNLIVKTDNYEANLQGMDEKEFPIIPAIENKKEYLEIEGGLLKESLSKTVIAAEVSDLRPEISGAFFAIEPSELRIVATDSFRLAEATISGKQLKNNFSQGTQITVPLKTAQELTRVLAEDEVTKLYTDRTQILFESESLELISRTIEGKFPDYQAIIPKQTETEVVVERSGLVGGLKLVGAFSGRGNEVTVRAKDKKVLELYASESNLGENRYMLPAKINGPEAEIVFNWQYLLDGVKNESSKDVLMGLNGEEKPTLIKSPESGANYFYILMPIKS